MKKIYIVTAIMLYCTLSFSQTTPQNLLQDTTSIGCKTPPIDSATFFQWPYFGNNQYLLDLVDSIEGGSSTSSSQAFSPQGAQYIPRCLLYSGNGLGVSCDKHQRQHKRFCSRRIY